MDWLGWATLSWMIGGICQGLAVAASAWVLLRLLPRGNAATRYALWWAALLLMIALPFAEPPAAAGAGTTAAAPLVTLPAPGAWPLWLLGVWVAAALWKLLRIGRSYLSMQGMKRRSGPVAEDIQERFVGLRGTLAGRRAAILRSSREVAGPVAAGLWRPAVLVPEKLLSGLSTEELDQILVHELAHLRRGDDWTNLLQKLIEAVLVFHPAVWWVGRRLNIERELASDDWVVALTGRPRPYAACLTKLAELRLVARHPQLAPGAAPRKRQIVRRIEALLDGRRNPSPRFAKRLAAAAGGMVLVAAGFAGRFVPVAVASPGLAALPMSLPAMQPVAMAMAKPRPLPLRTVAMRAVHPRLKIQRTTYVYVIYFAEDHAGWLHIVWVTQGVRRPVLKRT